MAPVRIAPGGLRVPDSGGADMADSSGLLRRCTSSDELSELILSRSSKYLCFFFFSSRRRHTRSDRDWSSDVCSSDLNGKTSTSLYKNYIKFFKYVEYYHENKENILEIIMTERRGDKSTFTKHIQAALRDRKSVV